MVDQRSLSVTFNQWKTEVQQHLFSSGILTSPKVGHGYLSRQDRVEFKHLRIFDYSAMKLFVSRRQDDFGLELTGTANWGLFLRPSLTLFFLHAWTEGLRDIPLGTCALESCIPTIDQTVALVNQFPSVEIPGCRTHTIHKKDA